MILDIDPKIDYAFKHLFGRENTRLLLVDLINQVLDPPPGHDVRDVELLNPFNPKESHDDKLSVLDVKARDQGGRQFNLEMQMVLHAFFANRLVYYLTRFHQQQLHEGDDYSALKPTIMVVFLNDVELADRPNFHHRFQLLETQHHFPYSRDLELHLLELPKFKKGLTELRTGLDRWLYLLKNAQELDPAELPAELSDPITLRVVEELKVLSQNAAERERYEARRKAQMDHISGLKAARLEGMAEGEAKGRSEGEAKGRSEGEAKGKIELIQFCERVLNLPVTPREDLQVLSLQELTTRADELQSGLFSRKGVD